MQAASQRLERKRIRSILSSRNLQFHLSSIDRMRASIRRSIAQLETLETQTPALKKTKFEHNIAYHHEKQSYLKKNKKTKQRIVDAQIKFQTATVKPQRMTHDLDNCPCYSDNKTAIFSARDISIYNYTTSTYLLRHIVRDSNYYNLWPIFGKEIHLPFFEKAIKIYLGGSQNRDVASIIMGYCPFAIVDIPVISNQEQGIFYMLPIRIEFGFKFKTPKSISIISATAPHILRFRTEWRPPKQDNDNLVYMYSTNIQHDISRELKNWFQEDASPPTLVFSTRRVMS